MADADANATTVTVTRASNAITVTPLALGRRDAAAAIGMSLSTFQREVLPALRVVKVGRRVLVPVAELERWLDRNAALSGEWV